MFRTAGTLEKKNQVADLKLSQPPGQIAGISPTLFWMLLCAITDRTLEGEAFTLQREALIARARLWASSGVDIVQLREKDLATAELISLAKAMRHAIRDVGASTRLILNAPLSVVLAAGADGIHLPANASVQVFDEVRTHFVSGHEEADTSSIGQCKGDHLWMSVACHTLQQVEQARNGKADCILFAPVFEKQIAGGEGLPGIGLGALAMACQTAAPVPILALGGVTAENAAACVTAGASGIAAIRLFRQASSAWQGLR